MKKLLILLLALSIAVTLGACCLRHEWTEATCTEPKTCAKCGKTEGEALGHEWTEATCAEPKTCTVCGATEGGLAEHTWTEATCTEPKTCTVCGATEGDLAEHTWTEATCTEPKTCTVCGATEGGLAEHTWTEATCTEPKTCTVCGATEGEALGHTAGKPDCTENAVCSVCGETVESAIGHNWTEATFDAPKTCAECGASEGDVLSPFSYAEEDGKAVITGYMTDCPAELVIPDEIDGLEVAAIGDNAFAGCSGLTSVTLPKSVVHIGANAFGNCPSLTVVNMPGFDAAEINRTAFENCGELTGVMGDEIFYTGYTSNCGDMEGEWEGSRGTCFHGVYTDVYHLAAPIRKCVAFSLDTSITQYNGNPFREWEIYVKRGSKAWEKVAEYTMSKEKAGEVERFTFEFEKPISFDSIAVADKNNFYHTVYYTVYLHDVVKYFSIDGK